VKYLVACFVLAGIWQGQKAATLGAELLWLTETSPQSTAAVNLQGHTCACRIRRMPTVCGCKVCDAETTSTAKARHSRR